MENGNNGDISDTQQIIIQANTYNVTVIPVEFPVRNRLYCQQQENDQFSQKPYGRAQWTIDQQHDNLNDNDIVCQWEDNHTIYEEINKTSTQLTENAAAAATTPTPTAAVMVVGVEPPEFDGPIIPICIYLHNKTVIMMEIEDTPSATCDLICQAIVNCDELGIVTRPLARQVFTLWMISPILEIQLKPHHKPYEIRQNWRNLIEKYGHYSNERKDKDEPKIVFQRNVFVPKNLEEKIKDQKILELLYEECKYNILNGRYLAEIPHLIMLGGIQAREELGPYNSHTHSIQFFREEQAKFLPAHARKSATWTWLPISSKNSAEVKLVEQFKRIPATATNRKLIKKYLEYCWALPFYGSAFFEGQIEEPVRGLISLLTHQDIPVLVAINASGIYIIDDINCQIVLGLKYEEFSWDCSKPSRDDNPDSLPCLFIQFMVVENGARVSKMLQVFSKQATLMDSLINSFVAQSKAFEGCQSNDNAEAQTSNSYGILCNKLSRLTLATFDEDGRCIGQMGSWQFSY